MINDDDNEVVLTSDENKYLLSVLKEVFAFPREEIYEVNTRVFHKFKLSQFVNGIENVAVYGPH